MKLVEPTSDTDNIETEEIQSNQNMANQIN